jgi:nickel/cobalt transporter (NicO) family protein
LRNPWDEIPFEKKVGVTQSFKLCYSFLKILIVLIKLNHMWQIFIGSLVLSLIHASIPNHWIPLIAIGKTEKWTLKETLTATLITGVSHTISTILIGIIVGLIGIKLSSSYNLVIDYVAPSILIAIGILYIISDIKNLEHHHHTKLENTKIRSNSKSKIGILVSLSVAMFLTPCVEIEAYYFQAGMIGWKGIFIVSAVYTSTTVLLMLLFVYAWVKGTREIRSHTLEHHDKLITGIVLIGLGILAFFVKL